ncbi:regulatory protein [Streptomyces sp. NL15-2K]|nr:hypothetical protein [Kutzneria buriramensis]WKX06375.1 hypothetical protein Q4V64_02270 [Kutzneria buriramensis]GCB43374.1 regulatory protein [Streptomyces sp. NL15-2K]
MAVPTPHGVPVDPGAVPLPPDLAELLYSQLETVADEVEEEVRRQVPEYARPADGTYGRNLRAGVVQALTLFVDHIADPRGRRDAIFATYYGLGRGEALEDRGLDALQSALRIGGLHAWRLMGRTAEELGLDSAVVAALGELAFRTVHEVAEAAAAGYAEARLAGTDELERRRKRLLDLLLSEGRCPSRPCTTWRTGRAGRCRGRSPSSRWRPARTSARRTGRSPLRARWWTWSHGRRACWCPTRTAPAVSAAGRSPSRCAAARPRSGRRSRSPRPRGHCTGPPGRWD